MRAVDVMVRNVVTVDPETDVAEAINLLCDHDVSALPVIGADGQLVGMLSEADLLHRTEIGPESRRPTWLESLTGASTLAAEFAKSHGKKVGDVMTEGVISVAEDAPLAEIATLFERKRIKRVPVTRDGVLVGIVSRSNLIQALAAAVGAGAGEHEDADSRIREELLSRLAEQTWTDFGDRNVIVRHGLVHLWGLVGTEAEHKALIALAEAVPGVSQVVDEMIPAY